MELKGEMKQFSDTRYGRIKNCQMANFERRNIHSRDGIPTPFRRDPFKRRSASEDERQQIVRKKGFLRFYCESSGHTPRD
ncbi:hypothetical protein COOONC_27384 [Cooperia oncophora]